MIGDKKAKKLVEDVQLIKNMIVKTAAELRDCNVVTRLYLRELMDPKDMALIKTLNLQKEVFEQGIIPDK